MKNKIKKYGIKNTVIMVISLILLTGVAYASVTVASVNKSSQLPWQGTPNGTYSTAHNVGSSYLPDSRLSFSSGSVAGGISTVFDSVTGLTWQSDGTISGAITWSNGGTYCTNLVLGGSTDWRLPNHMELLSIVDLSEYSPSIDINYFTVAFGDYWDSTSYKASAGYAWSVSFISGTTGGYNKTNITYVRCVY